jgi:hypothetical protein
LWLPKKKLDQFSNQASIQRFQTQPGFWALPHASLTAASSFTLCGSFTGVIFTATALPSEVSPSNTRPWAPRPMHACRTRNTKGGLLQPRHTHGLGVPSQTGLPAPLASAPPWGQCRHGWTKGGRLGDGDPRSGNLAQTRTGQAWGEVGGDSASGLWKDGRTKKRKNEKWIDSPSKKGKALGFSFWVEMVGWLDAVALLPWAGCLLWGLQGWLGPQ